MATLIEQPTPNPTRKVAAGGIGGALAIVLIYAFQITTNVELPAEVAGAVTLLVSFATSYIVKEQA